MVCTKRPTHTIRTNVMLMKLITYSYKLALRLTVWCGYYWKMSFLCSGCTISMGCIEHANGNSSNINCILSPKVIICMWFQLYFYCCENQLKIGCQIISGRKMCRIHQSPIQGSNLFLTSITIWLHLLYRILTVFSKFSLAGNYKTKCHI